MYKRTLLYLSSLSGTFCLILFPSIFLYLIFILLVVFLLSSMPLLCFCVNLLFLGPNVILCLFVKWFCLFSCVSFFSSVRSVSVLLFLSTSFLCFWVPGQGFCWFFFFHVPKCLLEDNLIQFRICYGFLLHYFFFEGSFCQMNCWNSCNHLFVYVCLFKNK